MDEALPGMKSSLVSALSRHVIFAHIAGTPVVRGSRASCVYLGRDLIGLDAREGPDPKFIHAASQKLCVQGVPPLLLQDDFFSRPPPLPLQWATPQPK